MPGVFDYINDCSHLKEGIVANADDEEEAIKDYNPFLTNRTFSYFLDSLSYAVDMNLYGQVLSKRMQYDYYFYGLRKKKRFSKQAKIAKSEDVELIQEIYGYDKKKAITALKILTEENLEQLRQESSKGGKQ